MLRTHTMSAFTALALFAAACGSSDPGSRYALQARLGVYDDGSGRLGLAVLATLRDASGTGPDGAWEVTLRGPEGGVSARLGYVAAGQGSYAAAWWPDVSAPSGTYEVVASDGRETVRASLSLPSAAGLPLPRPVLAADASRLDWEPVPGADAYTCRVLAGGLVQLEASGPETGCDLSALPAGAYAVSVAALSANLGAIGASAQQRPLDGGAFHVSEARLGFARTAGAAPVLARVVGGAYDDGIGPRAIAVWISFTDPAGAPTSAAWNVEIVGPNLPAEAPLRLAYPPTLPRLMAWAPEVPAAPGTYSLVATSTTGSVSGRFTIGAPAWLGVPLAITARDGAQGSAEAAWDAVPGARAYLASAYDAITGDRVASLWVGGTSVHFPPGTFVPGRSYDVFVAATDADMASGEIPTQVAVAENVFDFATFVAR